MRVTSTLLRDNEQSGKVRPNLLMPEISVKRMAYLSEVETFGARNGFGYPKPRRLFEKPPNQQMGNATYGFGIFDGGNDERLDVRP